MLYYIFPILNRHKFFNKRQYDCTDRYFFYCYKKKGPKQADYNGLSL